jgi:ketosteroid isomerase-like protein
MHFTGFFVIKCAFFNQIIFMRKLSFTAIFLYTLTLFGNAQEKLIEKQHLVQKTVIEMFQSLADRDLNTLKNNCTSDILILESGAIWNIDSLVQKVNQNSGADFKRINTLEFIETNISGNIAWTTYNNNAEITRNGKTIVIKWLETAIVIKTKGSWKIKNLHSTLLSRS